MRHFHDPKWTIEGVAAWLLVQATKGHSNGRDTPQNAEYGRSCTALHYPTGSQAILTRDYGHHTSGWWKNPQYERCLHLSLCFRDPETGEHTSHNHKLAGEWQRAVFGESYRMAWGEPPFTKTGKKIDVWHYRVFYLDEAYTVPFIPTGEVYSTGNTEAEWLSFSAMQDKIMREEREANERRAS